MGCAAGALSWAVLEDRTHYLCRPSQLFWLVFGSGPPPDVQLAMLERGLSVHEIALCRWRAWARYSAGWVSVQEHYACSLAVGRCIVVQTGPRAPRSLLPLCVTGAAGTKSHCSRCRGDAGERADHRAGAGNSTLQPYQVHQSANSRLPRLASSCLKVDWAASTLSLSSCMSLTLSVCSAAGPGVHSSRCAAPSSA